MNIKIQLLSPEARLPERATEGSIGYDLFVPRQTQIVHGRQVVKLDLAFELPMGCEGKIEPRSGFSSKGMEDELKRRMDADVLIGKLDSDWRGNSGVIINSHEKEPFYLAAGTKIAQLTIYKVELPEWEVADKLSETARGEKGFGSSGARG